jgi:hypothetical protein
MRMFLMFCVCLQLSGCYRMTLQASGTEPILLNGPQVADAAPGYQAKRRFHRELLVEYIFGINDQEQRLIAGVLQEETSPKGGVVNLSVHRTYRFLDWVVSVFTLGIYSRSLIIVEGDVLVWE